MLIYLHICLTWNERGILCGIHISCMGSPFPAVHILNGRLLFGANIVIIGRSVATVHNNNNNYNNNDNDTYIVLKIFLKPLGRLCPLFISYYSASNCLKLNICKDKNSTERNINIEDNYAIDCNTFACLLIVIYNTYIYIYIYISLERERGRVGVCVCVRERHFNYLWWHNWLLEIVHRRKIPLNILMKSSTCVRLKVSLQLLQCLICIVWCVEVSGCWVECCEGVWGRCHIALVMVPTREDWIGKGRG